MRLSYRALSLSMLTMLLSVTSLRAQDRVAVLEPDHVMLLVSDEAPESAVLRNFGLIQSADTFRTGIGASFISYMFENSYLELGWVDDEEAFRENWVWWDSLWAARANWKNSGASPFFLAFHRVGPDTLELPFDVPEFFNPDPLGGWVNHGDAHIPFLRVMGPDNSMPNPWWITDEIRAEAENEMGLRKLTGLSYGAPVELSNDVLETLSEQGALHTFVAGEHVLEMTFDGGRQGKTFDARPALPLVFHY